MVALDPGPKNAQTPRLGEELNLSHEQKNQLDELYLNNRRNLIDLKSVVQKERLEQGWSVSTLIKDFVPEHFASDV